MKILALSLALALGLTTQAFGQQQSGQVNVNNNQEANPRAPVSQTTGPTLVTSNDTCMGSSSIGAQSVTFGLSVGTTWTDHNCVRLKNARELAEFGFRDAALQLMCLNPEVRKAMATAGTPCESAKASPKKD